MGYLKGGQMRAGTGQKTASENSSRDRGLLTKGPGDRPLPACKIIGIAGCDEFESMVD